MATVNDSLASSGAGVSTVGITLAPPAYSTSGVGHSTITSEDIANLVNNGTATSTVTQTAVTVASVAADIEASNAIAAFITPLLMTASAVGAAAATFDRYLLLSEHIAAVNTVAPGASYIFSISSSGIGFSSISQYRDASITESAVALSTILGAFFTTLTEHGVATGTGTPVAVRNVALSSAGVGHSTSLATAVWEESITETVKIVSNA